MRRPLAAVVVSLGVLIACDEPVEPPTTGSLAVNIVVPEPEVTDPTGSAGARGPGAGLREERAPIRRGDPENRDDEQARTVGGQPDQQIQPTFDVAGHLTKGRVKLEGPTSRDTTISPLGASGSNVTLSGLNPGSYNVLVFGMVGDSVDYFGRTDNVAVTAGQTSTPTVTFQSFRPALRDFTGFPSYSLKAQARYGGVPSSSGYQVEWARNAAFTGSTTAASSDTTYLISVSDTGTYYVRVFAQNTSVSPARASDVKTFRVLGDTVPDTPTNPPRLRVGFGAFQDTVPGNIVPAADKDVYSITACSLDTIVVETRAARLTPASGLNTVLRLLLSNGTTQVAANDNKDGSTTDSYISAVAPVQDTFRIEVSGTGGTIGAYELEVRVGPGPNTVGTNCIPQVDLSKSVVTVSSASVSAGATSTFTLTVKDAGGTQIPFGGHTAAFSVGGGTSNGAIGTVTDNNNGTYTAVFTGEAAGSASQVSATVNGQSLTSAKPSITVTHGTAAKLAFRVQPAGATAGDSIQPTVEVIVQDAYGNQVPTATGAVTIAFGSNPSAGTLFGTVTKNLVSGVASFTNLKVDRAGSGYTLVATATSYTQAASNPFDITPGPAAKLAFSAQPITTIAGAILAPVVVAVQDVLGNVVPAGNLITVALTTNPVGAVLSGNTTKNAASGLATFDNLSIDKTGSGFQLGATATFLTGATSNAFNVAIGTAQRLKFTAEPTNTVAGEAIAPAIKVTLLDAAGNPVTSATDSVIISINDDPSGGTATLGGTKKVAAVSGVATFSNLSLNKAYSGYTLLAASGGLTPDTSATLQISPAAKSKLVFVSQPTSAAVGASITPAPQVAIRDVYDNLVSSATDAVTLAIGTNPSGGALFGNTTVLASGGIATFPGLSIDKAGTGYTLGATAAGLTSATSTVFNITSGTPVKLGFTVQPANAALGTTLAAVSVAVQDGSGNTISGATNDVTLALGSNPTSANLGGTLTVAAVNGVATFTTLTVDKVGTGYTLSATATGLTGATSNGFNITVGAPAKVAFTAEPSNAVAGTSIAPAMQVTIQDQGGNTVTTATNNVTLAFLNDASSGTATLGGTTIVAAVGGVATFSNITVNKAFAGYTLRATATGLASGTSAAFNISAAGANRLAWTVQPTAVAAGAAISPAPQVQIRDAFDNPVTTATNVVGVAIGTNPAGGSLLGTTNVAASGGTATFSNLNLDKAGVGYTLTASASGLTGATSTAFTVTAGGTVSASLSTAIASPGTGVVANGFDLSAITVTVRDPNGNAMSGQAVQIASTGTGHTITQPGGLTDANGQAVAIITSTKAETKTITVTVNPAGTPVVLDLQPTVEFVADASTISASLSTAAATPAEPDSLRADNLQQAVITVTVRDANSNAVPGQTVQLATSGSGTLTQPPATNASGVAVGAIKSTTAGSDTLTVTVNPAGSAVVLDNRPSVKFWVAPCGLPDAVQSTVNVDVTNVPANGVDVATITVTVLDCSGTNPVSGQTVALAVSGSGNTVTQPAGPTDGAGQAAGTVSSTAAGTKTITVTVNPGPDQIVLSSQPTVTFDAGAATQLGFLVQPSNTAAGASISPSVQVALQDALGNTVTSSTDSVFLALGTDPVGTTLNGTKRVQAVAGVATFGNLNIQAVGSGFTLEATSGALPAEASSAFTITPGAPAVLDFTEQPTSIVAGASITPAAQVTIRDAYGNAVASATNPITLAIGTNPGSGSLLGTVTRSAVAGVATFTGLSIDKAGTGYTLAASASGLTGDVSNAFNVTAGAAAKVGFIVQPSSAAAGASIAPAVQVAIQDVYGNTVTSATDSVTVALAANPGSATLSGTTRVAAVAGVATFSNLSLDVATSGYTLQASSGTLTAATSAAFTITPGTATRLVIVTEPTDAQAGVAISPAVLVAIRDDFGNTVTTAADSVFIAISTDPVGGTTLFGTTRVRAAGGFATFNAVNIRTVGTGFRLRVTSGALTPDTTVAFNITPGSPAQLAFTGQPSNVVAGANISPAVQVTVRDAYGNAVPTATNTVTVGIGANPGGGSLLGTKTVAAVAGVATFSGLSVDKTGTGYTLTASGTGLATGTSAAFNVTHSTAAKLGFIVQPSDAAAGAAISPAVQVAVQDAFGNTVTSATDSVTVAIGTDPSGEATLSGATRVAAVSGVATFSNLSINRASAGYTLAASSGSLTGAVSESFTITTGGATQLAFVVQPTNATAGAAIAPAMTVEARDGLGNRVTSFTDSITLAIANNAGGGTLSGTVQVFAVAGVATFSDIGINKAGTGYTLRASRTGLSNATSAEFNIVAGAPEQLGFVVQPNSAAAGDFIAPPVQVAVQDAFGNTVTSATNGVSVEIQDNPSGGTLFGTKTALAAAGVASFSTLSIDIAGVGYTLKATSTGLDSTESGPFTITAGAVDTLQSTVTADPTTQIADGVQTSVITVTVRDGAGTPVPGRTVQLSATGSGNVITQPASVTNASGVATGTIASTVAGDKTIEATVDPGGAAKVIAQRPVVTFTGDPGNVSAVLSTVVVDKTTVVADASDFVTVTVTVKDAGGNLVPDQTVEIAATGSSNNISPPAVTNASGVATGTVASTVAELKTITVTVNPGAGQRVLATQPSVTFVPGPPARLGFVVQPSNVAAGDPITAPVQVAVQDAQGNTITSATDDIALAIQGGKAGAELLGTYPVAAVSGIATFGDLSVDSAAAGYQLVATSGSLTAGTSASFDVAPGAADSVLVSPAGAVLSGIGGSTAPFSVQARDQFGNLIGSPSVTWTSLNDSLVTVNGSGTATAAGAGQATIQAQVGTAKGWALVTVSVPSAAAATVFADPGTGTTETFRGLWGTSGSNMFAVGLNGTIFRYNGTTWGGQASGTSVTLWAVWGTGPSNVVAVGGSGTILRYNSSSWSPEASGTTEALHAVWGPSPNDIYAVGTGGTVVHYDGTGWTVDTTGLASGAQLTAVWGTSASDVFVASRQAPGAGSPIVHFDGTSWTEQANPTNEAMVDLWGVAPDTVYAVGDDGFVLKYNGTSWSLSATLPIGGAFVNAIWGTASSDIYAVSQDRRMFHYDGVSWNERFVPGTEDLFDLWGTSKNASVYAAGSDGLVARGYRGGTVTLTPQVDTLIGAGDTLRLMAQAFDASMNPISNVFFQWTTSADYVVDVDQTGLATATATSDNDVNIWVTVPGGAADTMDFWVRVPKYVIITPQADTTFTLADTLRFTGTVYDWSDLPVNEIPVTWRSADTLIATVDEDGLGTAMDRGRARIIAEAGTLADTASLVVGVRMALIAADPLFPFYWSAPVPAQAFASPDTLTSDLPGHLDTLTAVAFNAMSPADLRAQYDVIGFGWYADALADADWTTRLKPYLELGGGVIFEDPRNVADLAPAITGAELDEGGPWTLHAVPALTDGTTNAYENTHLAFTAWDTLFAPFITKGSVVEGLYGRVGTGCITATGPDHMFHGNKGSGGAAGNQYNFFVRQVKWVTRCPLNDPPGPPASVIVYGNQSITAGVDSTLQLYGVVRDSMGTPLPSATITWSSTDEGVVTVDADGLVTAVDNGSAQIVAMGSGEAALDVTVDIPASWIEVTPDDGLVDVGGTEMFTYQAYDVGDNPITRAATWSSLNPNIATVDPGTGNALGVANGQVTVRAAADAANGYGLLTVAAGTPGVRTNAWDSTNTLTGDAFTGGLWGVSPTSVYGATNAGTVLRYNGSTWSPVGATGTSSSLRRIWGTSDNDIWVVGFNGTIRHWNGSSWRADTAVGFETASFYGVWGTAPDDVYAVGGGGAFVHYDGTGWTSIPTGLSATLVGVWGTSSDNVYVSGTNDVLLHWDGSSVTPVAHPSSSASAQWLGVSGTGPNDIHVVGCCGGAGSRLLHFDGFTWDTLPSPATNVLWSVWTTSPDEAFAIGDGSNLLQWDGVSWIKMGTKSFGTGYGLWGLQSGDILGGGSSGVVVKAKRGATPVAVSVTPVGATRTVGQTQQFTANPVDASGNPISYEAAPTYASLNTDVATVDPSTGLATQARDGQATIAGTVGSLTGYGLLTGVASTATAVNLWDSVGVTGGGTGFLWSVWGTAANNVFASGPSGTITRYNGSSWAATTTPNATASMRAVWGASATDLWAVGDAGTIWRSTTGTSWTDMTSSSPTGAFLYGMAGTAPDDIWAVGTGGTIIRYDGTNWTTKRTGTETFYWVWAYSKNLAFAVGSGGTILRWNGTSWSAETTPSTSPIMVGIWGTSPSNVYAVGTGGTIWRYNGSSWSAMTSPTTATLYRVWGSHASNDLYISGSGGTILRYDGATWSAQVSRTTATLGGIWGTSAGEVWAVGTSGQIRRGVRGGSLSATQVISFVANNNNTKMNIAWNGTTYHYANGGVAASGALFEHNSAGVRVDTVLTLIDNRSILYRSGTHYLKNYGTSWYTVNAQTGATVLQHSGGFTNFQSVPAVSLTGAFEIWEFTGGTIRRLNPSTGALLGTVTGVSGTGYELATDGYYIYTWNYSTRQVYVYAANIQTTNTAQLVTTLTLPAGPGLEFSLSFANGMLWAATGGVYSGSSTWYGYRLDVTP